MMMSRERGVRSELVEDDPRSLLQLWQEAGATIITSFAREESRTMTTSSSN
jgi:hypothetical protein